MRLLKIPELAEKLSISKYFVRKLIREGLIDAIRLGRAIRIKSTDVEQIILNGGLTRKEQK